MKRLFLAIVTLLLCTLASAQVSNQTVNPLPLASYTSNTVNSPDQTNYNFRGGHFIVNISSYISGNYTPHIQAKDPVSGVYYDVLIGTALSANGTTVLKVYPGIGVSANGSASDTLSLTWRVQLVGASTPSMTVSVDAFLLP